MMASNLDTTDAEPRRIVFTTDDLRPQDRLDAWNAAFGSLNEISVLPIEGLIPSVRTENWMLKGGIVLSETRVQGARFTRDATRVRRDKYDHWVIRVVRRGGGRLTHGRFVTATGPGQVVLFSTSDTWICEWENVEWVTICVPRDLDPRLTSRLSCLPPGIMRMGGTGLLADLLLALPARVAAANADEVDCLTGILVAAISACLPNDPDSSLGSDAAVLSSRERIRRAIRENIASSTLKPSSLAHLAGLSRSSLYRILEPDGGVSRYIRRTRLCLAYEALQSSDSIHKSIARIAEEHGFPDPPEFSRAFKTAFGKTPREVRADALAGRPAALTIHPAAAWRSDGPDIASRIYSRAAASTPAVPGRPVRRPARD